MNEKLKYLLNHKDYKIRNIGKMCDVNKGDRSLSESIMSPEVILALNDWISNKIDNCVLIGGISLSFYVKPRYTEDVDVIFLSKDDIPDTVFKFKRHRPSAFQHNKTHVEIELVTPELINTPKELVEKVFETSIIKDGIRIASPSALIALKMGRFNKRDQADIEDLVNYMTKSNQKIDLSIFHLSKELIDKFYKEF